MSTFGKKKATPSYRSSRNTRQETWAHHCKFGIAVSLRLLITAVLLLVNGVLPFIPVPTIFRIHDTSNWLGRRSWERRQERLQYMRGG